MRRGGALLQHGSILLDAEAEAWEALFGTAGRLITLAQLPGRANSRRRLPPRLGRGFEERGVRFEERRVVPIELEVCGARG